MRALDPRPDSIKHLLDATRKRREDNLATAATVVESPSDSVDPNKAQDMGDIVV